MTGLSNLIDITACLRVLSFLWLPVYVVTPVRNSVLKIKYIMTAIIMILSFDSFVQRAPANITHVQTPSPVQKHLKSQIYTELWPRNKKKTRYKFLSINYDILSLLPALIQTWTSIECSIQRIWSQFVQIVYARGCPQSAFCRCPNQLFCVLGSRFCMIHYTYANMHCSIAHRTSVN